MINTLADSVKITTETSAGVTDFEAENLITNLLNRSSGYGLKAIESYSEVSGVSVP